MVNFIKYFIHFIPGLVNLSPSFRSNNYTTCGLGGYYRSTCGDLRRKVVLIFKLDVYAIQSPLRILWSANQADLKLVFLEVKICEPLLGSQQHDSASPITLKSALQQSQALIAFSFLHWFSRLVHSLSLWLAHAIVLCCSSSWASLIKFCVMPPNFLIALSGYCQGS